MREPSLGVKLFTGFDKVVHVSMYLGTCSVFWLEHYRSRRRLARWTLALIAVVAPILMSGVIELAQAYLTTYRSGDWMDFLANSCGVVLALILSPLYRRAVHKLQTR